MPDYLNMLPEILGLFAAGGWLISRRKRKQENEEHAAKMDAMQAKITAALRESETKYTREALEIYTQQVVEPIRRQSERNALAIARYQGAIDRAPECRIYPDCIIVRELRATKEIDRDAPDGSQSVE